jgi:hypothetical protein
MTIKSTVLFDSPRCEIATLLVEKLRTSVCTKIVVGFATKNGLEAIDAPIQANPSAVDAFVIGAGTYSAFDAFDRLLERGVRSEAVRVHLGHAMNNARRKRDCFRPMLHSKVYYMEDAGGNASAIIGSHNLTGFALLGMNGEAAVLLEGQKSCAEFAKIRSHIDTLKNEAVVYSPSQRDALAWWTQQQFNGMRVRLGPELREIEKQKTIVLLCEYSGNINNLVGTVYFEISTDLGKLNSLSADIHLYVFAKLPSSPQEALGNLDQSRGFRCKMNGLNVTNQIRGMQVDWFMNDARRAHLEKAPKEFRPSKGPDMQQVSVKIESNIGIKYEYLFDEEDSWSAVTDSNCVVQVAEQFRKLGPGADRPSRAGKSWALVKTIDKASTRKWDKKSLAIEKLSPKSGTFLLVSLRRRNRDATADGGSP